VKRLRYLIRPALNAIGRRKLTILVGHRVHPAVDALFPNAADAARFDEVLSWVSAALNVIPLAEAIDMLRADRLPDRAACITFDDGYADNVDVALPILLRHRLSATFFITTGFLDGGRMWNDTIIEAVRRARGTTLDLSFLGLGCRVVDTPQSRRLVIDEIIGRVKYLPPVVRQEQVDKLAHAIGEDLPRDIMMRSDQVRSLYAAGMSIGAHTVTHPILMELDPAEALAEIRCGREALESIVGARVSVFAYPNGQPGTDYGTAHVAMVRDLGFSAALSTRRGTADASSDLYQLPRFGPWGKTFLRFGIDLARNYLDRR
jgi:peptidoglycan/xylan/chitin deacetylase (PgdA/CDA1 family)